MLRKSSLRPFNKGDHMSTKEMFKQKMEAEVARAQNELARFRARGMAFTAEAKDRHDEYVAELERKLDATKAGLRELGKADEHVWESLKDGVEHTWGALQSTLQDAIENFKTQPHRAGKQESDEGAYPYGLGLKGRSTEKVK
jgi:DNA repair photolyase